MSTTGGNKPPAGLKGFGIGDVPTSPEDALKKGVGAIPKVGKKAAEVIDVAFKVHDALDKLGSLASKLWDKFHSSGKGQLAVEIASGDHLDVRQFSVHERMSSVYRVKVIALCKNADIDMDDVLGRPAKLAALSTSGARVWSGICNHFRLVASETDGASTYEITIVPRAWLLSQRRNYRMFQQKSELDIVRALLAEWDVERTEEGGKDKGVVGTYKEREYKVQYAETDLAFASRLLEDVGISFYFPPEEQGEKMSLADEPHENPPRAPLPFLDNPMEARREHVTLVRLGQRVRPGRYTIRDHDFRLNPGHPLLATATDPLAVEPELPLERFHYIPGAFLFRTDKGDDSPVADNRGKSRSDEQAAVDLATKRLAAKRNTARLLSFRTNAHDVAPGTVVQITNHPKSEVGGSGWLVIEASFAGTNDGDWFHDCVAVSTALPYRPPVRTPKPQVGGVESATVVGPPSEAIHCDEFGRVQVHFHWEREPKKDWPVEGQEQSDSTTKKKQEVDPTSSCWIPVCQPWAGVSFGMINLPRVGQEVLVDFVGGDPDKPVIVGRLFTQLQPVPYKLPANKTQSGWRSKSVGKNSKDGYNEIMFEDKGGVELVRVHAQKDLSETVLNNATHSVGVNRSSSIGVDDSTSVGTHYMLSIAKNKTAIDITDQHISVSTATASVTLAEGNISLDGAGDIVVKAGGTISIDAPKVYINCKEDQVQELSAEGDDTKDKLLSVAEAAGTIAMAIPGGQLVGALLLGSAILGRAFL